MFIVVVVVTAASTDSEMLRRQQQREAELLARRRRERENDPHYQLLMVSQAAKTTPSTHTDGKHGDGQQETGASVAGAVGRSGGAGQGSKGQSGTGAVLASESPTASSIGRNGRSSAYARPMGSKMAGSAAPTTQQASFDASLAAPTSAGGTSRRYGREGAGVSAANGIPDEATEQEQEAARAAKQAKRAEERRVAAEVARRAEERFQKQQEERKAAMLSSTRGRARPAASSGSDVPGAPGVGEDSKRGSSEEGLLVRSKRGGAAVGSANTDSLLRDIPSRRAQGLGIGPSLDAGVGSGTASPSSSGRGSPVAGLRSSLLATGGSASVGRAGKSALPTHQIGAAGVGSRRVHDQLISTPAADTSPKHSRQDITAAVKASSKTTSPLAHNRTASLFDKAAAEVAASRGSAEGKAEDWEEFATEDGLVYYHNEKLNKTQWTMPDPLRLQQEAQRKEARRMKVNQGGAGMRHLGTALTKTGYSPKWTMLEARPGVYYYFDKTLQVTQWDRPDDFDGVDVVTGISHAPRADGSQQVSDWERCVNDEGFVYYYNSVTKRTQWTIPAGLAVAAGGTPTAGDKAGVRRGSGRGRAVDPKAVLYPEADHHQNQSQRFMELLRVGRQGGHSDRSSSPDGGSQRRHSSSSTGGAGGRRVDVEGTQRTSTGRSDASSGYGSSSARQDTAQSVMSSHNGTARDGGGSVRSQGASTHTSGVTAGDTRISNRAARSMERLTSHLSGTPSPPSAAGGTPVHPPASPLVAGGRSSHAWTSDRFEVATEGGVTGTSVLDEGSQESVPFELGPGDVLGRNGWVQLVDDEGYFYFHNMNSELTQWEKPADF